LNHPHQNRHRLAPVIKKAVWAWGRDDSPPVRNIADLSTMRIGVIDSSSAAVFLRDQPAFGPGAQTRFAGGIGSSPLQRRTGKKS